MSKISLQPNASGAGTFTIEAPATNTNRVLELPDEAGKVLTDVSDIAANKLTGDIAADRMKDGFNASGAAPIYACRAWVNFNGSNGSIRASGNVSSVTRNSTGNYTVNFTTAMPDANYSIVGTCMNRVGNNFDGLVTGRDNAVGTNAFGLFCSFNSGVTAFDSNFIWAAIFR